jgi:hypothetical protein
MTNSHETIERVVNAPNWNQRVAQIRLIPQRHGTGEHAQIFADIARVLYVPHLAPDFAYIHEAPFYEQQFFATAYGAAEQATEGFTRVSEEDLTKTLQENPGTLLVFRTILGLTKEEFAQSTRRAAAPIGLAALTSGKVDSMERHSSATTANQARVVARTICLVMDGSLFSDPPPGFLRKQAKPDTEHGWTSVRQCAAAGVPFATLLHQRHYGGAFRQVLDATSTQRGNLIEAAVEALLSEHRIPFIRTGSNNQAEIAAQFEVRVTPAPDFVIFDETTGSLKAILECKGANDGGTARDKALRFKTLRDESVRLGGIPLIAVLGGTGWTRVNDALGPVVRDTEGRVFTLATLHSMVEVSPFPSLVDTTGV